MSGNTVQITTKELEDSFKLKLVEELYDKTFCDKWEKQYNYENCTTTYTINKDHFNWWKTWLS